MHKSSRSALLVLAVLLPSISACDHGQAAEKLSLKECIETALKDQPAIRAARENVRAGQGRETQAASPYFPQLTASTGYSESHAPLGGAFGDSTTKSYTTSMSINQTLYDFGKTGNAYDAAKLGTLSLERDAERISQEVVLNVKQSYYALLAAKKLVEVAQKTIEQTESHLKQAEAFFRTGSKPRYDVTRAEVEVNNARLGLINAKNGVRIRTIALNNAMGIDPGKATEIVEALPAVPVLPTLEQAQLDALQSRPDMKRMEADIAAARARLTAEQANYLPTLSANAAYHWANGSTEMGPFLGTMFKGDVQDSWNAGIMLTLPLFQGGLTKGRVAEARANVLALEAQRDSVKQSILLEVNQAFADLESAAARVEVMEKTLQKARENLDIAQGRYKAGVGPYIEVTDAQLSSVNAETDRIKALYDYHLAIAQLLKAMGSKSHD
ncbi:MAG: TolC family protein [Nitrospirae bacterium]|nr:TolC family protein [Nitrospirota bacterium]NTW64947.1 TolC family protein [Nitrospirota bacterium]